MSKPDFMISTYINCTQDALWSALRDPEAQMQFDFLGQSCVRRGDALVFSTPDGHETLVCTETRLTPKTRLETSFEPKWGDPNVKPSRVVYVIEPFEGYCKLTVEHHDLTYAADPDGGTADGWQRTLAGLKTWLETGKAVAFGGPELFEQA